MSDLELTPEQGNYNLCRCITVKKWERVACNMVSLYEPRENQVVRTIRDLFIKHHDPLPVLAQCKAGRKDCEQRKETPGTGWSSVENNLWASGEINARELLDLYERAVW